MDRVKRVFHQIGEKCKACQDDEQPSTSSTSSSEIPIGIPIIIYSADDGPTSPTTMDEKQVSGQLRLMSLLYETPVTIYRHTRRELDAPKKSTYYLCKVQRLRWILCRKSGLWNHMD
ncbi:hypothetical protein CHARACLAT_025308 [Characodon lateralis]|uniref:Uncharacterized protein n=1 Tax=Characodon lateralis TaxID=208331 RepID=A0ABU7DU81_9TELE|nr:hypothetical protein [Characodon lateralis]